MHHFDIPRVKREIENAKLLSKLNPNVRYVDGPPNSRLCGAMPRMRRTSRMGGAVELRKAGAKVVPAEAQAEG